MAGAFVVGVAPGAIRPSVSGAVVGNVCSVSQRTSTVTPVTKLSRSPFVGSSVRRSYTAPSQSPAFKAVVVRAEESKSSSDDPLAFLKTLSLPGFEEGNYTPALVAAGVTLLFLIELKAGAGPFHVFGDLLIKPLLELIGFSYTVFFVVKKLLLKEQRAQLKSTFDSFVTKVKGG